MLQIGRIHKFYTVIMLHVHNDLYKGLHTCDVVRNSSNLLLTYYLYVNYYVTSLNTISIILYSFRQENKLEN